MARLHLFPSQGPWELRTDLDDDEKTLVIVNGESPICEVLPLSNSLGEAEANTALIIASPELLAACEAVIQQWVEGGSSGPIGLVYDAVEKARGRS